MPFCQSCGAEIKPGKKFCSSCGAPVAPPAVSALPSSPDLNSLGQPDSSLNPRVPQPPAPSSEPAQSRDKLIIAAVMGAAILGIIIFIGIPLLQPQETTGRSLTDTFQTQSVPAHSVPASATTVPATMLPSGAAAASFSTTVYRSGTAYDQVFARDYSFEKPRQEVFTYYLELSPMIVECEMNPEMVSREQLVDIGTINERYITSTYANPGAYLDLKVINTDTGRLTTTISFSKNYRGELKQTYTIRSNGNYRFELTGNLVSPVVRLLVKK